MTQNCISGKQDIDPLTSVDFLPFATVDWHPLTTTRLAAARRVGSSLTWRWAIGHPNCKDFRIVRLARRPSKDDLQKTQDDFTILERRFTFHERITHDGHMTKRKWSQNDAKMIIILKCISKHIKMGFDTQSSQASPRILVGSNLFCWYLTGFIIVFDSLLLALTS